MTSKIWLTFHEPISIFFYFQVNTGRNIVGSASLSSPLTRNLAALCYSSSVPTSHWTAVPKPPAPITLPLSPVADTRPPGGALQGLSCGHSASGERVMGQARSSDTPFPHLCPLMFLRWIQTYRHNPSRTLNKRLDTQLPLSSLEVTYEGFHPCPTLCLASTLGRSPLHHYSSYDVLLLLQVSQSCICLHKRCINFTAFFIFPWTDISHLLRRILFPWCHYIGCHSG